VRQTQEKMCGYREMPRVAPERGYAGDPDREVENSRAGIARPGGDTRRQSVSPRLVLFESGWSPRYFYLVPFRTYISTAN
jgi:hypothetical protein